MLFMLAGGCLKGGSRLEAGLIGHDSIIVEIRPKQMCNLSKRNSKVNNTTPVLSKMTKPTYVFSEQFQPVFSDPH
jgi:hypothetical protein